MHSCRSLADLIQQVAADLAAVATECHHLPAPQIHRPKGGSVATGGRPWRYNMALRGHQAICHCQAAGSNFVHGFCDWAKQRVTRLCDRFGSIKAKQTACSLNSNWFTGWSTNSHRWKKIQCVQEDSKPKNTRL